MGRPLNKKYFGQPEVGAFKFQITEAWLPGEDGPEAGFWIVKQTGTGRFIVTDGTKTGVVKLVDAAPLAAGEATISFETEEDTIYAKNILGRLVKSFDEGVFTWNAEGTGEAVFEVTEEEPEEPEDPEEEDPEEPEDPVDPE